MAITSIKTRFSRLLFFLSGIGIGISIGKIVSLIRGYCPLTTSGVMIVILLSIISFLLGVWFAINGYEKDKKGIIGE